MHGSGGLSILSCCMFRISVRLTLLLLAVVYECGFESNVTGISKEEGQDA